MSTTTRNLLSEVTGLPVGAVDRIRAGQLASTDNKVSPDSKYSVSGSK
jgi:hypothetical protein